MKMKKKQKTTNGTLAAHHPRDPLLSKENRESTMKSPTADYSGIGWSFTRLLDRTRAYFQRGETVDS